MENLIFTPSVIISPALATPQVNIIISGLIIFKSIPTPSANFSQKKSTISLENLSPFLAKSNKLRIKGEKRWN